MLTRERPLLFRAQALPGPVFAFGRQGSGLTALAMALSMRGYRCCSDVSHLPKSEHGRLFGNKGGRVFDAYVNIGSLGPREYVELAKVYPRARFIVTEEGDGDRSGLMEHESKEALGSANLTDEVGNGVALPKRMVHQLRLLSENILILPARHRDKWELLSRFLGGDYPTDQYPQFEDQAPRKLCTRGEDNKHQFPSTARTLRRDSSPWIVSQKDWRGIAIAEGSGNPTHQARRGRVIECFQELDRTLWALRDDTFPSNLALFKPDNFSIGADSVARLTLREESTSVREYTSASVCSRQRYLYGRFEAELRPAKAPGLITGVFLHRNSPRQEIDIEFLGRDTTRLLLNVYYNPGGDGARMEYGYRGTPILIDLGFDASEDFHRYEIEWRPTSIRWHVDGRLAYERVNWDPTPIPHLPMQFNINLWHSRSEELAGQLASDDLPAQTAVRALEISA